MFSTFPDGWPGIGLLLLRVVLGGVLATTGVLFLRDEHGLKFVSVTIVLLLVATGALLLAGYWTRCAATIATLAIIASLFSLSDSPDVHLFDNHMTAALAAVIAVAVACLGPGAFSLDSRLFGRREIIIPKSVSKD